MSRTVPSRRRPARRMIALESLTALERREAVSSLVDLPMFSPRPEARAIVRVEPAGRPAFRMVHSASLRNDAPPPSPHVTSPTPAAAVAVGRPGGVALASGVIPSLAGDWLVISGVGNEEPAPSASAAFNRAVTPPPVPVAGPTRGGGGAAGAPVGAGRVAFATLPSTAPSAGVNSPPAAAATATEATTTGGIVTPVRAPAPAQPSRVAAIQSSRANNPLTGNAEAFAAGDPIIEYNHSGGGGSDTTFSDVIGDGATVYVEPPPGSGLSVKSVAWTVTNAYSGPQKINPKTGFVNTPLDTSQITSSSISFFWDETGGGRTIKADVALQDAQGNPAGGGPVSLTGTVVVPKGNIVATYGTPGVANTPTGQVLQYDKTYPAKAGITWTATIDPTTTAGKGGTLAVIQTWSPSAERRFSTWNGPFQGYTIHAEQYWVSMPGKTTPRPIADDDLNGDGSVTATFYGNLSATVGSDLKGNDSPSLPLGSLNAGGYQMHDYSINSQYNMFLMYNPGGIWVPIGTLPWGWGGVVTWNGTSFAQETVFTSPPGGGSYSATSSFPTWSDSTAALSPAGWVETSSYYSDTGF